MRQPTGESHTNPQDLTRRALFRRAAVCVAAASLVRGNTLTATVRTCIFVLMDGAPSHTDTFDLKEGPWTPSYFDPISYRDLRFPRGLMPKLTDHLESVALVRNLRAPSASHPVAREWLQTGSDPLSGGATPHMGTVVSRKSGLHTVPAFVSMNAAGAPGTSGQPAAHQPFYCSPDGCGSDFPGLHRALTFDRATQARYGATAFGNACAAARNLAGADFGTRFIQITHSGWDHHEDLYPRLRQTAREFDAGLGELIADLRRDGTFHSTLIVAVGEFGRTGGPLNASGGRDHALTHAALVAGGGVRGGRALGSTDRDLRPEDLQAAIYAALGIDAPSASHGSTSNPLHELWA